MNQIRARTKTPDEQKPISSEAAKSSETEKAVPSKYHADVGADSVESFTELVWSFDKELPCASKH